MKITVLGAGAMGALFGGYLAERNEVYLVDVDARRVERINAEGVRIREQDGTEKVYHPAAVTESTGLPEMDLVIVFVKAMYTESALEANRGLIGPETYLMTLQNGAGHEAKLLKFADRAHVVIGTTQHNSSLLGDGHVNHGGGGKTVIGLLDGGRERLRGIAEEFTACGFACATSDEVKAQIWQKLFLNTAASTLTGILQVPLGYILENRYACELMEAMAREAVTVANADGFAAFDAESVIGEIKEVLSRSRAGYTSIYADVKNGARTEVDTISGSVVEAAHAAGVPVPYHEMAVALIHALEGRGSWK